jgi:hypothetical protein
MTRAARSVREELDGLSLGDRRIDARALEIAARLAAAPDDSFPEQMASDAELEGLYRFFANPKVTTQGLLGPHVRATHERMRAHSLVRVVHDTSAFSFAGEREGLGILKGSAKGFLGHTSLAISGDETREPLGVLAMGPYIHANTLSRRGMTASERVQATVAIPRADRESSRWEQQAVDVQRSLPESVQAIHLMDQEGDDFYVYAALQREGLRFVIRAEPGRVTSEKLGAKDVLARQPAKVFRTVRITERKKEKRSHPARAERMAELEVRWGTIVLRRPRNVDVDATELSFNAVHVFEPSPPSGEAAVEWMLLTTERVDTLEDATSIVDHYRARWIVEEYFKVLKTGCAIEKRQLTTFAGLTNALALFVPIAWRLLALRHLSRIEPPRPAAHLFEPDELLLLRALLEHRGNKVSSLTSTRDVMLGIARLGGHIRNNGDPGWLVLGRGYLRFAEAKVGWQLARKSDQS